ncbi:hypothetical protein BH20ACI4_BH20ACI4_23100 [soil metagenome]
MTDLEQEYIASLRWENGGEYMIGLKKIAPHKTIEIDVKKIRDEQIPDFRGRTIPLNMTGGQIKWSLRQTHQTNDLQNDRFALIGRSEQIDTVNGISSSYACQNCCSGGDLGARITADPTGETMSSPYDLETGNTIQLYAFIEHTNCYNEVEYCPYLTDDWDSSNDNIATVSSNGLVTVVGAGDVEIDVGNIEGYLSLEGAPCSPGPYLTDACDNKSEKKVNEEPTESVIPCGQCDSSYFLHHPEADIKARKLEILRNGQVISNPNSPVQNVIVGEKIDLTTRVVGGTGTQSNRQWTTPGTRIANYEVTYTNPQSQTNAFVTELTNENLTQSSIQFYWVDGGNPRNVQYSVRVNNKSYSAIAKFNVKKPTATITTTTGSVGLGIIQVSPVPNDTIFALHFGKPFVTNQAGIRFNGSVALPSGVTGETIWVQVVNSSRRTRRPNGGREEILQGSGLDTEFPYGEPNTADEADSPYEPLEMPCNYVAVSANDSFSTYLLFKPQVTNGTSIYIPLKKVDWSWSGTGTRGLSCSSWTLSNPTNTQNPTGMDTTEHPEWVTNITQFDYPQNFLE